MAAFEADRAKDAELKRRGVRALRLSHRQVADDPGGVAMTIRRMLGG